MTRRRILTGFAGCIGLGALLWLVGLLLFVAHISSYVEPSLKDDIQTTDAIVVLTGGSERLQTGIELLREGKAKKLLISGVHPGVGAAQILAHSSLTPEMLDCCVTLGHTADNTLGNAEEASAFMQEQGFHSLRLVTANYHMPRSLFYFRNIMPTFAIVEHPVAPDIVSLSDWWQRVGTASLLIGEYDKFLYALSRVSLGVL